MKKKIERKIGRVQEVREGVGVYVEEGFVKGGPLKLYIPIQLLEAEGVALKEGDIISFSVDEAYMPQEIKVLEL